MVLSLLKLNGVISYSSPNAPGFDMKQSQNINREKSPLGLVRCHPITSVLVLWITLLLLAGLSTAALVNVNNSEEAKTTQLPPAEPSISKMPTQYSSAEPEKQTLPWLSLGAIALSCTLGCLFLQTFRSTGYQPVQRKTARARSSTPPQLANTNDPDSFGSSDRSQSDSSNASLITSVTVVSKQQNHPLDWDEPSLADSLDIRQRRPLSHWL